MATTVPVDPPAYKFIVVGCTDIPVTATGWLVTVTTQVAVNPPSTVVAVILAVPTDTGVTTPVELTVATPLAEEVQFTF